MVSSQINPKSKKPIPIKDAPAKRKSRVDSEARIFKAGMEAFSKFGYEAASTKQIAQKAKINEAMIFRYFGSKEGLLTAVLIEHLKKESEPFLGIPEAETLEEEIKNFLVWQIKFVHEYRDFTRISVSRAAIDSKIRNEVTKHIPVTAIPKLAERLKRFQDRGDIPASTNLMELSHVLNLQRLGCTFSISMIPELDIQALEERATEFAAMISNGLRSTATKQVSKNQKNK